jgi:1-acyl-sn-glycerol-3-phosphate acyltransferase
MFLRCLKRGWYVFALWACRMFCVVFFRMHLNGQENIPRRGPFLLISNHQSYLDPIFCGAPLRRQLVYVARDTLFRSWIFRNVFASVGAISVRRGVADLTAIKRMLGVLGEGFGLCLFPEATRTSDGRIAPLRPGFSLLCRKANAPIVPVVIDGAFQCWPRRQKVFSPFQHIWVWYGRSIEPQEAALMSDEELAAYVTDVMRRMLNDCREKFGRRTYEYDNPSTAGSGLNRAGGAEGGGTL